MLKSLVVWVFKFLISILFVIFVTVVNVLIILLWDTNGAEWEPIQTFRVNYMPWSYNIGRKSIQQDRKSTRLNSSH